MDFNDNQIKSQIISWIINIMSNRPDEFSSYENLEAHIRNHMINETTKFISMNKNELESLFDKYKTEFKNVS